MVVRHNRQKRGLREYYNHWRGSGEEFFSVCAQFLPGDKPHHLLNPHPSRPRNQQPPILRPRILQIQTRREIMQPLRINNRRPIGMRRRAIPIQRIRANPDRIRDIHNSLVFPANPEHPQFLSFPTRIVSDFLQTDLSRYATLLG